MTKTFRPCPKQGKKPPKAPKWLRRYTPLKPGKAKPSAHARFIEHGKDPTKTYHRKRTDAEVMAQGEKYRRQRLASGTPAEEEMDAILRRNGVGFEREKVWLNGDRPQLTDFYIASVRLVIEVDGKYHDDRGQMRKDRERSMWLARKHKCHVVRFSNAEVINGQAERRVQEMLGLP